MPAESFSTLLQLLLLANGSIKAVIYYSFLIAGYEDIEQKSPVIPVCTSKTDQISGLLLAQWPSATCPDVWHAQSASAKSQMGIMRAQEAFQEAGQATPTPRIRTKYIFYTTCQYFTNTVFAIRSMSMMIFGEHFSKDQFQTVLTRLVHVP